MDREPNCPRRYVLNLVRYAGWQEDVFAGIKRGCLSCCLQRGFAPDYQNPFVLRLYIFARGDFRRAYDAFNDKISVSQDRIEAFALARRLSIVEYIARVCR